MGHWRGEGRLGGMIGWMEGRGEGMGGGRGERGMGDEREGRREGG